MAAVYTELKKDGISINTGNKQEEQLLLRSDNIWKIKHRKIHDNAHSNFTYETISEQEAMLWLERNNHRPSLLTGRSTTHLLT